MIFTKYHNKIISFGLCFIVVFFSVFTTRADDFLTAGQEKRNQIIYLLEICDLNNLNSYVTRAEFAKMLIKASDFRDKTPDVQNTSAFLDVDYTNEYVSYIKKAVNEKYMASYLGNLFKPNNYVIYKDVIRGILALLGYINNDFAGNNTMGRINKFTDMKLGLNVYKSVNDTLTKQEIINIFYNLLKAYPKNSKSIYGTKFNLQLENNGEIDGSGIIKLNFEGPILVTKNTDMEEIVDFSLEDAVYYLNGMLSSSMNIKTAIEQNGYAVVYYNKKLKALQFYSEGIESQLESNSLSISVGRGFVDKINTNASAYQVPYSVEIDGQLFYLESSQAQLAFSPSGGIKKNDEVVFMFEKSTNFANYMAENSQYVATRSILKRTSSGITTSVQKYTDNVSTGDVIYRCILGVYLFSEGREKTHFGNN